MDSIIRCSVLAGWLFAQVGNGGGPGWDALVRRGVELRLAGDEAQALVVFREAEGTARTPRLLAQMALAEQSLGRWLDAEAHLLEALAGSDDPWIAKHRETLDEALVTIGRHVGSLELRGPSGADVLVDGRPQGRLPRDRPLRLEIGRHRVEIRSEGTFPFARDVEITSETTARETAELLPVPRARVGAERAVQSAAGAGMAPSPVPSQTGTQQALGWTFLGSGAAAAVFGVASLLTSNEHARDYNGEPACTGRPDEGEGCRSAADAARRWRVASTASFAVGGALVTAGVVVLLWKASPAPARLQFAPGNRGVQIELTQRF